MLYSKPSSTLKVRPQELLDVCVDDLHALQGREALRPSNPASSTLQPLRCLICPYNPQELLEACVDDLHAVRERDAACVAYIQPLLFFKGFQALQAYRLAHWLWGHDRKV